MRSVAVSLLACLISGIVSGIVAQQLAVRSGAGEEFILVFMLLALALLVAGACFFVAQFFGMRAIDRTGMALTALSIAGLTTLWLLVRDSDATRDALMKDLFCSARSPFRFSR